jgi:hypothetical protein
MSNLSFSIKDIVVEPYQASPQLTATLRVEDTSTTVIHAIALRCQVQIEPQRRGYQPEEGLGLTDQFGTRDRWPNTLKPFLWMQCGLLMQGFRGATEVELPLPVTYDFEVTSSRYLHALREGVVPLVFMFSGTVFTRGQQGFGVEQVPWDREARYAMPVPLWRSLVDTYWPNSGWLRLDRDTLTALGHVKATGGHLSFDQTIWSLLVASRDASEDPDSKDASADARPRR